MSKHVLIVGGGIIGLATAYACAGKGHRVTLVERGGPGRDGCSFVNAGMVVPSHVVPLASPGMVALGLRWMWNPESPFWVRPRISADLLGWAWKFNAASTAAHVDRAAPVLRDLHLASRECYREWAARWREDFGLVERGMLMLCNTERGFEAEAHEAERARALGMRADVLAPAATAALEPALRMTVAGAVHYPMDCHLAPERLMTALAREVERAGVEVKLGTGVAGWRTANGRIAALRTDRAEEPDLVADEYVVCAGFWSQDLVRDLGVKIPMQAGKGYSLTLADPPALPKVCAILSEARVAVTPMDGALRFAGTMELGGRAEGIDASRVRGIAKSVATYFPDIPPDRLIRVPARAGLRPCSPDGLPYVGRVAAWDNLSVATGHAMMGMSLGPITGTLMAELLSGERPSCDIGALSPDRYA